MDQSEQLFCFAFLLLLLKPVRDYLAPGFPRARPPWPSRAEERWGRHEVN